MHETLHISSSTSIFPPELGSPSSSSCSFVDAKKTSWPNFETRGAPRSPAPLRERDEARGSVWEGDTGDGVSCRLGA